MNRYERHLIKAGHPYLESVYTVPAKVSQLVINQVRAWDSYFKALAVYQQDSQKFTGKGTIR